MSRFISLSSTSRILAMCFSRRDSSVRRRALHMGLSRQALAYRSRQFGEIRLVFGDDPLGLSAQNADIFRSKLLRRHHDNRDIRVRGTLAQLTQEPEAVHLRHHKVEQDQVWGRVVG